MLEHLENVSFVKEFESKFMKPMKLVFDQDGKQHNYDLALSHSSVITLLYHTEFAKFLVVRQFRPAVFLGRIKKLPENVGKSLEEIEWSRYNTEIGYTIELCGGIVDKDIPLVDIAREEVEEECGYSVPSGNMHLLGAYSIDADESGSIQHLYYAEIDESMRINAGGGNEAEGEAITNVFLSEEEAHKYVTNKHSNGPPGVFFAFLWWFQNNRAVKKLSPSIIWSPTVGPKMENFHFEMNHKSNRYHPIRMCFSLNKKKRLWDLAPCDDSVAAFVYNKDTDSIILTQRFRPAVVIGRTLLHPDFKTKDLQQIDWKNHDEQLPYTLEMCSTHVLVNESDDDKVKEAVLKKLGYSPNSVEYVTSFAMGISQSGDRQKIYFIEVSESDKVADWKIFEDVVPVSIKRKDVHSLLCQPRAISPPAVLYMIEWYLNRNK